MWTGHRERCARRSPRLRDLGKRAKAFPKIIKAGLLIGGRGGDGALRVSSKAVGHYDIAAASFGLQAGAQSFSYALFFMRQAALEYLRIRCTY
jgi:lipid-binding SYLF domain-containing protein